MSGTPKDSTFAGTKKTMNATMAEANQTHGKKTVKMDQTMVQDKLEKTMNPARDKDENRSNCNSETSDDGSKRSDIDRATKKQTGTRRGGNTNRANKDIINGVNLGTEKNE